MVITTTVSNNTNTYSMDARATSADMGDMEFEENPNPHTEHETAIQTFSRRRNEARGEIPPQSDSVDRLRIYAPGREARELTAAERHAISEGMRLPRLASIVHPAVLYLHGYGRVLTEEEQGISVLADDQSN